MAQIVLGGRDMKYWWLAVTPDELELPLAVAETAQELGKMLGISGNTIMASEFRSAGGRNSGRKFIKVPRED
jgi:hypothetical protein